MMGFSDRELNWKKLEKNLTFWDDFYKYDKQHDHTDIVVQTHTRSHNKQDTGSTLSEI